MKNLLLDDILAIQKEYCEVLKEQIPYLENEETTAVALDSIAIFWRRRKKVIDLFLRYIAKQNNTYIYTAATYFDVENGEQYPFLLLGDTHIFDDPLGRYCEICYSGNAPQALSDKVLICAKDNIDIIEKCDNRILVLPLRFMGKEKDEREFLKIGEDVFLEFFPNISDMPTYFKTCLSMTDLLGMVNIQLLENMMLVEDDDIDFPIEERLKIVFDTTKKTMGEENNFSDGELFYFAVYGPIQQALDIIALCLEYGCVPLIRYPITLQYILTLLPNFREIEGYDEIIKTIIVMNSLYKVFDYEELSGYSLSEYQESVAEFDFENKALNLFDECNSEEYTMKYMDECKKMTDSFLAFLKEKTQERMND